jgi:hypothetical protein
MTEVGRRTVVGADSKRIKVFWLFFSKKNRFLVLFKESSFLKKRSKKLLSVVLTGPNA